MHTVRDALAGELAKVALDVEDGSAKIEDLMQKLIKLNMKKLQM